MNADGSDVHTLNTDSVSGQFPVWSPNGQEIAFQGIGSDHFIVVNAGGTGLRDVSQIAAGTMAWSPDGESIAFSDWSNVYTVKSNGSDRELLTQGFFPSWGPAGDSIAFSGALDGQDNPTSIRPG
jgi:Tol biopolymer transport system component